jgi:hypothetical protein
MQEPTYEIPEDARVGDILIPAGTMTARQVADHINASSKAVATVITRNDGSIALAVDVRPMGIPSHFSVGSLGIGPNWRSRPFSVGRAGLRRDPNDPLEDNPCARRHHASGCRWCPGKGSAARGWTCVWTCPVVPLLDAKAERDAQEAADDE